MTTEDAVCRRKEPRFKTSEDKLLKCEVFVDVNDPVSGRVIDISPNGLRLFCEGEFKTGTPFLTELNTDVLHGVFPGIIRRVTPWIGGGSVLGCQLLETIPDEVLETLAKQHIVNRRRDDRVEWNQPATMSWELGPGEIDVTIQDCSPGGLKLYVSDDVPADTCVRLRLPGNDESPIVIDAKSVWKTPVEGGWELGLSFIRREIPESVVQVLSANDVPTSATEEVSGVRRGVVVAAAVATFAAALALIVIR